MNWFKHDINTQRDIKIRKLLKAEGYLGYGLFWNIVEAIYDNGGSLTEKEAQEECELAGAPTILKALLDIGLLDNENGMVTSKRITECIEEQAEISRIRKEAGAKGLEKRWDSKRMANAMQMDSNCLANDGKGLANHSKPIADKIREDKIREEKKLSKESKEKAEPFQALSSTPLPSSYKRFTKPSLADIESYCRERNNSIDAQAFFDFYESKNWFVGKNKMVDWKACVRTWEQRETREASQPEVIKGTNIRMAITADGSNPDRYKNSPTMEELYQMTRSGK